MPFLQPADVGGETRRTAVHANAWQVLSCGIPTGMEPLQSRRKVEKTKSFDLETHDPDSSFSIIATQQRDQAVIKALDAVSGKRQGVRASCGDQH